MHDVFSFRSIWREKSTDKSDSKVLRVGTRTCHGSRTGNLGAHAELGDAVEDLDPKTMDIIGNSAKQLNKELEEVLRKLQAMKTVNYDKNKIDLLFEMLEAAMQSEDHVTIILDRL